MTRRLFVGGSRGVVREMPIKIKMSNSRGINVEVRVRRPSWQQFITY